MVDRNFRFGVVAAPRAASTGNPDVDTWRRTARRAEELGYSTLLMPDGLQLPSVAPSLAVAAEATTELHVGSFVMASVLRPPRMIAYEANSLSALTGGRFELGLGTGNPAVIEQATEQLGYAKATGPQRLAKVGESIEHLRALDGDQRTPVLVAAGGPKARELAAAKADSVTIAAPATAGDEEYRAAFAHFRDVAGSRADEVELSMNVFVIGDEVPPQMQGFLGSDGKELIDRGALTMLRGSAREMADELQRRRDAFGVSYISVNGAFLEEMAPVVELLRGR